ncbi:hypothetical protein J6590_037179 [Homalodisca vitripennis]|nr:hypothetical protein J6590_037179 [Homalodisca vitripennis]
MIKRLGNASSSSFLNASLHDALKVKEGPECAKTPNPTDFQLVQQSFTLHALKCLRMTYCVDSQVADSACSATAYLSGVKGNMYTLGVTAAVGVKDWINMKNESLHTTSILKWAQDAGKSTGIVSTSRITDASPAATYAHSAYRKWQTDLDIKNDEKVKDPTGVKDIASQLIEDSPGNEFKVILGGGWDAFLPNKTEETPVMQGARGDDKDLIKKWKSSKKEANKNGVFITRRDQLQSLDVNNIDYLLGLFQSGNMKYNKHVEENEQPTLSEMTKSAIKMLQKDAGGFVLFVEGGLIDIAHHENKAHLALDETVELHKAVKVALEMTHDNETLIVVTADHAHTLNFNGYPKRGGDILTYVQGTKDLIAYSTLSYANGPHTPRFNPQGEGQYNIINDKRVMVESQSMEPYFVALVQELGVFTEELPGGDFWIFIFLDDGISQDIIYYDINRLVISSAPDKPDYTFQTINLLPSGTHDGQDVTVFANGPWAHLLVGNYEQTVIPYVMGYAAQIGPAAKAFNLGSQ